MSDNNNVTRKAVAQADSFITEALNKLTHEQKEYAKDIINISAVLAGSMIYRENVENHRRRKKNNANE